jgi:long-chain acyl-CoA synthetase
LKTVDVAREIIQGLPNRVHEVLVPHLAQRPDHPAFAEGGRLWSYREFGASAEAVAADLVRLQVRPGDRVLVASENSVAFAAFVLACSKLDAWAIAANPRLSARELDQINVHSGARRILITAAISKEAGSSGFSRKLTQLSSSYLTNSATLNERSWRLPPP